MNWIRPDSINNGILGSRKVLWHGRPAQLGRSVGPPKIFKNDRSIWSNLKKSFSLFRTVELSIKMFSPPPFGLSLESEPVGFRLNLIAYLPGANTIKDKVCAWAHYLMQNRCERENQYGRSGDWELSRTSGKERLVPCIPFFPKRVISARA